MRTSRAENRGLKHYLKNLLLPSGRSARTIRMGILAGVTMDLDFAHHTQRWLGLQEIELSWWLRRLSRGIRTAIDVGANDGVYTLFFLAKTPTPKVLAFEPASDSVDQLKRNLALNGFENDPRFEIVTRTVGATANGQDVTLDSYLGQIQFPCVVKVDIDGGEASLLKGARQLLASNDTYWIIEIHSQALEQECLGVLQRADYRTVVVRNAWWRLFLPELRPADLNRWIVAVPLERT